MVRKTVFWPLLIICIIFLFVVTIFVFNNMIFNEIEVPPVLGDGHVGPWRGTPNDTFTFTIICNDTNGNAPEYLRVVVNGTPTDMNPIPGAESVYDYITGIPYICQAHLSIGNYTFHFEAKDNSGITRFPLDQELPLSVIHMDSYLANATASPMIGTTEDTYTFSVVYVGKKEPLGTGVQLHLFPYRQATIDDYRIFTYPRIPQSDPNATNYSEGVEFQINVTLESGNYWYYYACDIVTYSPGNTSGFHYPDFYFPEYMVEHYLPGPRVLETGSTANPFLIIESQRAVGLSSPVLILTLVVVERK